MPARSPENTIVLNEVENATFEMISPRCVSRRWKVLYQTKFESKVVWIGIVMPMTTMSHTSFFSFHSMRVQA